MQTFSHHHAVIKTINAALIFALFFSFLVPGEILAGSCSNSQDCPSKRPFCSKDVGDCDGTGSCIETSGSFCTEHQAPVCGCDGKTYGNSCKASRAEVNIAKNGACADQTQKSAQESQAPVTIEHKNSCNKTGADITEATLWSPSFLAK